MKKVLWAVLFLVLFAPLVTNAEIIEESKMAKALANVDKNTIVVFDIDSTILEAAQVLGSDPWFYITGNNLIASGMNKNEARETLLKQWIKIQRTTEVEPVEINTPELIRKIQNQGIKVVALTARSFELMDITVKQLNSIGVDFTRNPLSQKDFDVKFDGDKARYFKGVIFCGGGLETFYNGGLKAGKGVILNRFLKILGYSPQKVIFLDDKKTNVEAVDKALTSNDIECKCIRYGAADSKYKTYNPELAKVEMEFFDKILSDDAARAILKLNHKKH